VMGCVWAVLVTADRRDLDGDEPQAPRTSTTLKASKKRSRWLQGFQVATKLFWVILL
jgi:hypothetical protein